MKNLTLALCAAGFALSGVASAGPVQSATIDSILYGHLDQNTTNFCLNDAGASYGCGPVATVNSLLMLDNRYGSSLVPDADSDNDIDTDDLKAAASTLSGLMGCDACNGGTSVANLIAGKRQYFNNVAPGEYYVHDRQSPTFSWLLNELNNGQDIELLVGFYDNTNTRIGGHYITLNGISWDDLNSNNVITSNEASIDFIDPSGGVDSNRSIYEFLGGSLGTSYGVGGTIGTKTVATTSIEWGIAESPVPEPGTLAMMFGGALLAYGWRRRLA